MPCPPFSKAGKQLGTDDERDLFPEALRLVEEIKPRAVMLENVRGWPGAERWREQASDIAPTLVGGSKKHGGPDLGPTRAKKAWATLGVDGRGIADDNPAPDFVGMPRLTVRMAARKVLTVWECEIARQAAAGQTLDRRLIRFLKNSPGR